MKSGRRLRRMEAAGCVLVLGVVLGAFAVRRPGRVSWAWNFTASEPRGLYVLEAETPGRGDLVVFCPPTAVVAAAPAGTLRRGGCPGGFAPHLKRLVAVAGDAVRIDREGVWVNGRWIEGSRPVPGRVGKGARNGRVGGVLGRGEFVCLGEHPGSFDGRYYGPVRAEILGRARALWTWTSTSSPGS